MDETDPTSIAVLFSESTAVCDEWLASKSFVNPDDVVVLVVQVPTGTSLPFVVPLAKDQAAVAVFQAGCEGNIPVQKPTGGTISITKYTPGSDVAGSVDAVLPSGHHVTLTFDTCFCTASTKCSTVL
jgi:hypothetical protein